MHGKTTLAVDFDGVIHRYSQGWQDGRIYDPPVEGAMEGLLRLGQRHRVVVHTSRTNIEEVRQWIHHQLAAYLEQPMESEALAFLEVTNIKPKAIAYIDDRAIRFTHWPDVLKYFG